MPEITLPASMAHLETLIQFVNGCGEAAHFPVQRIREMELALEEALVNIVRYAYPETGGDVTVSCRVEDSRRVVLNISDGGIPFNVLEAPFPDLTADVDERKVGGLGVYLIKRMADEARYRRDGNRNLLELTFDRHRKGAVERQDRG